VKLSLCFEVSFNRVIPRCSYLLILYCVGDGRMNIKHWLSYMDTGKPKFSEKNLFQCHLVHHKYHMLWPGIKHGPHSDRWATIRLSYDVASCLETSECNSWWDERTLSSEDALCCTKLDPKDWNKRRGEAEEKPRFVPTYFCHMYSKIH
jgi:hypothetical protein